MLWFDAKKICVIALVPDDVCPWDFSWIEKTIHISYLKIRYNKP